MRRTLSAEIFRRRRNGVKAAFPARASEGIVGQKVLDARYRGAEGYGSQEEDHEIRQEVPREKEVGEEAGRQEGREAVGLPGALGQHRRLRTSAVYHRTTTRQPR